MWRFLAVLRSFFHSSLLCNFSCHPSPPTILPSSLTSSCHLFLGLPLNLIVPKFIYNTLLGILFSSTLCTCPNQHNLFNLTVSIIVGFLTLAWISLLVNILQFSFPMSYTRNILHEIHEWKANWIGHILRRNCLLQRVTEGKIQGGIEVTGRQGRRHRKLLDDLNTLRMGSFKLFKRPLPGFLTILTL